ncbi:aconitase family protein, partial [Staphylococcus epidermidis]|uniref:aconitase family protein n=1 Tax=Staphylococcus epidermidis TaxID=1282 RepID=UPI0037DA13CF
MQPHQTTFHYLKPPPYATHFHSSIHSSKQLYSHHHPYFHKLIQLHLTNLQPQLTSPTNPQIPLTFTNPFPQIKNPNHQPPYHYIPLHPPQKPQHIKLPYLFLPSSTSATLSHL